MKLGDKMDLDTWLEELDNSEDWCDSEEWKTFKGIRYYYSEYDYGCEDMQATLIVEISKEEVEFTRHGYKNMSYDRWIDTTWYNWE